MTAVRSWLENARSVALSTVIVLSLVAIGVTGSSGVVAAETEITDCTVITSSGTYVLGADLTKDQTGNGDACIEITADDVFFDGQGYAITGGAPITNDNFGILIDGATNVTVTDVVVRNWTKLGTGVKAEGGAADITVTDVTARNNTFGVRANTVDVFTIENVVAGGNERTGVQAFSSTDGIIRNVTVVDSADVSGWGGIRVRGTFGGESSDILIDNVTSTRNDEDGIIVGSFMSNVTLTDVTATENIKTGLELFSDEVTVGDVTAYDNNWSVRVDASGPVEVQSLDLGNSTAPNTTISFEGKNVLVRENTTPPDNPLVYGIGRYFEMEELGNGYLDVAIDYEPATFGHTREGTLTVWEHDGTEWDKSDVSLWAYPDDSVVVNFTDSRIVGVFGPPPVASFDVSAVNDTVVQGEELNVTLTNVTHVDGGPYSGELEIEVFDSNGTNHYSAVTIIDGETATPIRALEPDETEDIPAGDRTLRAELWRDHRINTTFDVEIAESPVRSFEVVPLTDTVSQGHPFAVEFTNVTHVRGGPYTGELNVSFSVPTMPFGFVENVSIVDGESTNSVYALEAIHTAQIEPGEYEVTTRHYPLIPGNDDIYNVTVVAPTFEVESEFAGVVHDDGGLRINATRLPTLLGNATLTVAGQEISEPIAIENGNVSATVDLSEHLDPETATGTVTVKLEDDSSDWRIDPLTDEVRLVHEAHDLDEGYTRWSIPQPAEVYVSDGVVDMTQWSNADTSYDDVGFQVNTGETVTDGEDLHKGLYVNAGTADERIGYDYVTPGEEGLAPGGAETIDEGWHLLSSNYDVSSGNETLNLDLNTVSSLPPTAADYEGDEGMVAHDPSTFVRIGGDDVVGPYDTYWVYVDVGVDNETRAISTAEYDPAERESRVEALSDGDA